MLSTRLSKRMRGTHGGTLVEGSVALMLVTWMAGLTIFFLLTIVLVVLYKIKLTYAVTNSAAFATERRFWLGGQRPKFDPALEEQAVSDYAKYISGGLGLGQVIVDFSSTQYTSVKITALDLPLLRNSVYPQAISLQDQAYFPYVKHAPVGWYGLTLQNSGFSGGGMGLYHPSYGAGIGTPPPTSSPVGATNTFTVAAYGTASSAPVGGPTMAGAYQDWDGGGPFVGYY
jgi:hypothetical protein